MRKLLFGTILLALAIVVPVRTIAGVDVSIGISLPPLIAFEAPPEVVVIPDSNNVYVVPEIDVDFFFWNGWWWRPWKVVGIAPAIITGGGLIIIMSQVFILM